MAPLNSGFHWFNLLYIQTRLVDYKIIVPSIEKDATLAFSVLHLSNRPTSNIIIICRGFMTLAPRSSHSSCYHLCLYDASLCAVVMRWWQCLIYLCYCRCFDTSQCSDLSLGLQWILCWDLVMWHHSRVFLNLPSSCFWILLRSICLTLLYLPLQQMWKAVSSESHGWPSYSASLFLVSEAFPCMEYILCCLYEIALIFTCFLNKQNKENIHLSLTFEWCWSGGAAGVSIIEWHLTFSLSGAVVANHRQASLVDYVVFSTIITDKMIASVITFQSDKIVLFIS